MDDYLVKAWSWNYVNLINLCKFLGLRVWNWIMASAKTFILGQILPFLHILSNAQPKNNVNKVPRWVFRYVGNKAYDFSSKKKDFLPKNDQIWPKIGIFGQFGPGHAGLFNALLWVGWWLWRAGCISQDTYLLYILLPCVKSSLFAHPKIPRKIVISRKTTRKTLTIRHWWPKSLVLKSM